MSRDRATGVITSIHPPSEAIRRFARAEGLDGLIVIGDLKTPEDWACDGVDYWDVARQKAEFGRLADLLPMNHYCRKNLGYLVAAGDSGWIYDTDDDNLPVDAWRLPVDARDAVRVAPGQGFVNVYSHFSDEFIWPRGFPLNKLRDEMALEDGAGPAGDVPVWQGLADDDPDVDAIYRMVVGKTGIKFRDAPPLVLSPGSWSPFNSQNTAFAREAFALLYLPVTVTFRYTDILRSYVALAVLEAEGKQVGFSSPRVYQERNVHDLMRDFADEVPMYLTCERVMADLTAVCRGTAGSMRARIEASYRRLEEIGVTTGAELPVLMAWLDALEAQMG